MLCHPKGLPLSKINVRTLHKGPQKGFVKWYQDLWNRPRNQKNLFYNHVIQIGDPMLRQRSLPVEKDTIFEPGFKSIVMQLRQILEKYDSLGLSAVQIGVPCRMFAIQMTKKQLNSWDSKVVAERQMEEIPFQVFINPELRILNNKQIVDRESCTSVYGFSALVPRFEEVEVSALNEEGETVMLRARGWKARILQHEMDHLDGKLFVDKMDRETFVFNYWNIVNHRQGNFKLGYSGISGSKRLLYPFHLLKATKS